MRIYLSNIMNWSAGGVHRKTTVYPRRKSTGWLRAALSMRLSLLLYNIEERHYLFWLVLISLFGENFTPLYREGQSEICIRNVKHLE